MMFLGNLNMESLILMAGSLGDVNALAAMVIGVSIGEFLIMIPYGLALASAAFIGNAMGANRPILAKANTKMFIIFALTIAVFVCFLVAWGRHQIISIYGANNQIR
jgi:Na+-driven multidrug efflux pump